jgi:hypothetical protein
LVYVRGSGADRCPDELALRSLVAARLGDDPFTSDAVPLVSASVRAEGDGLRAEIELSAEGKAIGRRELASPGTDCKGLAAAMALAISIATDSLEEAGYPRAPVRPVEALRATPPPQPPAVPPKLWVGAGGFGSVGAAPSVAGGPLVQAEVRWPSLALGLEGLAQLPSGSAVDGGQAVTSLLMLTLAPCIHRRWFGACGLASGGILRAWGEDLPDARSFTNPYFAVGARVAGEWEWTRWLSVKIEADLRVPVTQSTLLVNDTPVWTTPAVSGSVACLVLFRAL